jgi:TolB protein
MKKFAIFVYLTLITFAAFAAGPQRKIAFERGDNVWIANLDGSDAKKVAAGSLPGISPDATRLAFNTDEDSKTRPGPKRHIAIADLASGKVTVLKDIPSDNCFGPVWSPDGSKLAFSIMAEKEWRLGLVNADGSGFRFVKNAGLKSDAFGEPAWARWQINLLPRPRQSLSHRSRGKCPQEVGAIQSAHRGGHERQ